MSSFTSNRRTLLASSAAVTTVPMSGCVSGFFSHISLRIQNTSSEVRELDLNLYDDGSSEYEYSAILDPSERVATDDVVSGGEYTAKIVIDGKHPHYRSFGMNGCDEQIVYIGLRSEGDVVVRTSTCG